MRELFLQLRGMRAWRFGTRYFSLTSIAMVASLAVVAARRVVAVIVAVVVAVLVAVVVVLSAVAGWQ